nr:MAG TPA_asm: hypothetical protein [Caudoviricetes sp.]
MKYKKNYSSPKTIIEFTTIAMRSNYSLVFGRGWGEV